MRVPQHTVRPDPRGPSSEALAQQVMNIVDHDGVVDSSGRGRGEAGSLNRPHARFGWVAVTPLSDDTDLGFATDMTDNQVWMWHPATDQRRALGVDAGPVGLAITRDGRRLVVACADGEMVEWVE